jgi:hypothetical protein
LADPVAGAVRGERSLHPAFDGAIVKRYLLVSVQSCAEEKSMIRNTECSAASLGRVRRPALDGRMRRLGLTGRGWRMGLTGRGRRLAAPALLLAILVLPACGQRDAEATVDAAAAGTGAAASAELPAEQAAFWERMREHCGRAYAGRIADATPYYLDRLEGSALVIHFRECSDDRLHVPMHVDDNRSRNWILTRAGGTIRLKHDHRGPDGTEEEVTQYGGDAPVPGLATRQTFPADAHTATILPDRFDNFWFMDFMDDDTFAYGVHWPKFGHSLRIVFDLTTPVEPPPAPWGF